MARRAALIRRSLHQALACAFVGVALASGIAAQRASVLPLTPVYRIALRVHTAASALSKADLTSTLAEVNQIWWSQARICFEITTVADDQPMTSGFDLWIAPDVRDAPGFNGLYNNDHSVWSTDHPMLDSSPDPVRNPAARTSAHELGHGLGLSHDDGQPDSPNVLMSSGRLGWHLRDAEIQTARERAKQKALTDTTPTTCADPQVK